MLVLLFSFILNGIIVFADSPSFVRQEIKDPPLDWILWKESSESHLLTTHEGDRVEVKNAYDISECKKPKANNDDIPFTSDNEDKEFFSPDIQSVSYISNKKYLNGTIWLTSDFIEPSILDSIDTFQEELGIKITNITDSIDTFQEELGINITKKSLTLENYTKFTKTILAIRNPGIMINEQNSTLVAGNPGYKIEYTLTERPNESKKIMHMWFLNSNKSYEIIYTALIDKYSEYLISSINHMIKSLMIADIDQDIKSSFYHKSYGNIEYDDNFFVYKKFNIKMLYPNDWYFKEDWDGVSNFIKFISPFENETHNQPSWHETRYIMAIDIDSVHDTGTDYRVILFRTLNNDLSWNWTREVREISSTNQIKVIEQTNNYTGFYNKNGGSYVEFSLNLDNVNSPERYKVVFYVTDLFAKNHHFCRLLDTTNWINIPPPMFDISTEPSDVISLRPGEETNIQLRIKSNTDLESKAVFFTPPSDNGISINIPSEAISVPSSNTGTSTTINIKALSNATVNRTNIIPLITNISFPSVIVNSGGDIFNNSKTVSINETSGLTIRILPPYNIEDQITYITNKWITPLSGIWTFVAAVGAVVIPLIVKIYHTKRKNRIRKEQSS